MVLEEVLAVAAERVLLLLALALRGGADLPSVVATRCAVVLLHGRPR